MKPRPYKWNLLIAPIFIVLGLVMVYYTAFHEIRYFCSTGREYRSIDVMLADFTKAEQMKV